jgi:hypothetical protein
MKCPHGLSFNLDDNSCLDCGEDPDTLPLYKRCQKKYLGSVVTVNFDKEDENETGIGDPYTTFGGIE